MNNKAITSGQGITLTFVIILLVAVAAAAYLGIDAPGIINSDAPVTVYIEDTAYSTNLTVARPLDWTGATPGNTYTKNMTVVNNDTQALTLQLFTTEPLGSTQTWPHNNTLLASSSMTSGTLTLTLDTIVAAGPYTWKLFATNTTIIVPTPTPTPDPSTAPTETLQFTIEAETGVQNITVSINADTITLTQGNFPTTFLYQTSDTLTFRTSSITGYTFNAWIIDLATVKSSNPLILTDNTGNFTIQAKYLLTP